MKIFLFSCLFLPVFTLCVNAQGSYRAGLLPAVTIDKKLPGDYKLNFKTESRQQLRGGTFGAENALDYDYLLTDFSLIGAKKIAIDKSLTLGYLLRLEDGKIINRSIQQFIATKLYREFKLAHRIAADQTFEPDADTEFRLRYRLAAEIALNGQSVDVNEFYLKINNEYLNALEGGDYDLEIRFVPLLGYKFPADKKLEAGLDYRFSSFIDGDAAEHRFWFGINLYQSI